MGSTPRASTSPIIAIDKARHPCITCSFFPNAPTICLGIRLHPPLDQFRQELETAA